MSEIIHFDMGQSYVATPAASLAIARAALPSPFARTYGDDTVEFSSAALARAVGLSSQRIAATAAIRGEIESGTFETPERIEGTVERLLDVFG